MLETPEEKDERQFKRSQTIEKILIWLGLIIIIIGGGTIR